MKRNMNRTVRSIMFAALTLLIVIAVVGCNSKKDRGHSRKAGKNVLAMAEFTNTANDAVAGRAYFSEGKDGNIVLYVKVKDLAGENGVHIYDENGHYNPTNSQHGLPTDDEFHVGDFGNAKDGKLKHVITDSRFNLEDVMGLTINVYSDADQGSAEQPSGGAGEILYSGVIMAYDDDMMDDDRYRKGRKDKDYKDKDRKNKDGYNQ